MHTSQVNESGPLCKSFLSTLSFSMTCGAAPEFPQRQSLNWNKHVVQARKRIVSGSESRESCFRQNKEEMFPQVRGFQVLPL